MVVVVLSYDVGRWSNGGWKFLVVVVGKRRRSVRVSASVLLWCCFRKRERKDE
jgi:hypothetical protein